MTPLIRPYHETRASLMATIYAAELTPKEVLLALVDLNERFDGRFERCHAELSFEIDRMWQEVLPG